MALLDVRRLAAVDMHGMAGRTRRRQIIRAEFFVGAIGCTMLGVLSLAFSHGWGLVLGIWLVGVGLNYVPLAINSQSLSRPGALEAELAGVDLPREARRVGVRQLWILVPLAVVCAAIAEARRNV
jgi:hypothetical protein